MDLTIDYGTTGMVVDVPDDAVVVRQADLPALPDEQGAITAAVTPALDALLERDSHRRRPRVTVVFPDITRPMPNPTVLPPLLRGLEARGAGPDEVVLLCGTGTHRSATPAELEALVGPEVMSRYDVRNHVATADDGHVAVGKVDGVPVLLDRAYVEADVRILTGFVEPHFFAGFSGGPKGACPGVAGLETILECHSPTRIASRDATWLRLEGNPVHDFVRAAHALCPAHLAVDVAINDARQVTAVFTDHRHACAFVERTAVQRVGPPFDVVVTTNNGYPLDRNLYQCVKGLAAAERVVHAGGTIVMAAECSDGVPAEGDFGRILAEAAGPAELVSTDAPKSLDRWQVQVLGRVLQQARVPFCTTGLSADEVRAAHLEPVDDVSDAVAKAVADVPGRARVCVIPHGPLTVATSEGR